jgi:hypothetical protein
MRHPLAVLALMILLQRPLGAQLRDVTDEFTEPGPVRGGAGFHLDYASPQGPFAVRIDRGFGVSGWIGVGLDRESRILIGVEGGFMNYHTRSRAPGPTPGSGGEEHASNNIVTAGIPLRIEFTGGPVRPYTMGSVGGSYFTTFTITYDEEVEDDFAVRTLYSDLTLNWTAGLGVVFQLREGRVPLYLDLGIRHVANGVVNYLDQRSLDGADGSGTIRPIRSEANLTLFKVGVAMALR